MTHPTPAGSPSSRSRIDRTDRPDQTHRLGTLPSAHATGRRRLLRAAAALPMAMHVPSLFAQQWPARPIRFVVASAAGSGGDIIARILTDGLSRRLGQSVIVDNRPGATGIIATEAVVRSPPDGYTLLFTYAAAIAVNHTLQPKLSYDTFKDLAPIAQVGAGGNVLVVSPDLPVTNLREFVDYMKLHPDKYNYGSWGIGSGGHLVMEGLKMQTGVRLNHVPYTSMPQIYNDMQNGAIKVAFVDSASSAPLLKAGKIRGLAISGSHRAPLLPTVATMTEQGFPFDTDAWYGVFAPGGTPAPIIERLNGDINALLNSPETRNRLAAVNLSDPPIKSVAEFTATLHTDVDTWKQIIRTAHIRLE